MADHVPGRAGLSQFGQRVPLLLARHPVTADQARALDAALAALQVTRRFRVAVTGKIKQGKSTLINALVGQSLPTVGVNETTATINVFERGEPGAPLCISIHWHDRDKPPQDVPAEELAALQGADAADLAGRVRYIGITCDSPLLEHVQLIDTPGEGGRQLHEIDFTAAALIRALPFTAEEADADKLAGFGRQTRPFGSAAYNSVAVIQKWEEHWPSDAPAFSGDGWQQRGPLELAWRRAREQECALRGAVSAVVPVSGMLRLVALECADDLLAMLVEFVRGVPIESLERMVVAPNIFRHRALPGSPLEARAALWEHLRAGLRSQPACVWPILKMAIWSIQRHQCEDAAQLRRCLFDLSNFELLSSLLEKRFFALADVIQTGVELESVLAPCERARKLLLAEREVRQGLCDELASLVDVIQRTAPGAQAAIAALRGLRAKADPGWQAESAWIERTCGELEEEMSRLRSGYALIQREISCLHQLDELESDSPTQRAVQSGVRTLFGQFGIEPFERLGATAGEGPARLVDRAWAQLASWRSSRRGLPSTVGECAVARLEKLIDVLQQHPAVDD